MRRIIFWRKVRRRVRRRPQRGRKAYLEHKEAARALVHARLKHWNEHYQFKVGKIFIKNHSTRWGSCSTKGNLNFNYRLALIDPLLADYVIVHELCHLGEFNHSPAFWALVAQTMPNYKTLRRRLRTLRMK